MFRGAVADRLEEEIVDRVTFSFAPCVEERRGDHEVLRVQEEQTRDQVFLICAFGGEDLADILAHSLSIRICKAEDCDRSVVRDGKDIERDPGLLVLMRRVSRSKKTLAAIAGALGASGTISWVRILKLRS